MRIGYDLGINSPHVEREFTTYKSRFNNNKKIIKNTWYSQFLPTAERKTSKHEAWYTINTYTQGEPSLSKHQLNGKAYTSIDDKELTKYKCVTKNN